MKKGEKSAVIIALLALILIAAFLLTYGISFITGSGGKKEEKLTSAVEDYMSQLDKTSDGLTLAVYSDGEKLYTDLYPTTADGQQLYNLLAGKWSWQVQETGYEKKSGYAVVDITCPDLSATAGLLSEAYEAGLKAAASQAEKRSEVYNSDLTVRQDVQDSLYSSALDTALQQPEMITVRATLLLEYSSRTWTVTNPASGDETLDARAAELKTAAAASAPYASLTYKIPESATSGMPAEQSAFGETTDTAVVLSLLQTDFAKNLINGAELVWNENIPFVEGSVIRYYLDESILMIQWQELESQTVATFAEVFVSDGSQLRRKIAGDSFGDMGFMTTSQFAQETNAVLCVGGDFYNHARNCGIVVLNREIYRFDPVTCDVCYITSSGDMLFSYRNQFAAQSEAEEFIRNNDVLFSLSFGPVLVDNGVDVTPDDYLWGEINDTYARSSLGMLGEKHYLTMNMNCTNSHYYLATLRDAADAMISKGCIKAYTLDGGQTATTVVNSELVNPVQFGTEKMISDVIYFASAIPTDN